MSGARVLLLVAVAQLAAVAAAWLLAAFAAGRAAGGVRAGWLTAALAALTPVFLSLSRRIALDGLLALALTAGMFALLRAFDGPARRPRRGPWLLALACGGAAFLAKGIFGTFLFVAPILAHAALSGDRRAVRALFRPASLLLLALPVAAWAWALHAAGGMAYVAEAFFNNSIGRFVGIRFDIAGTGALPYGDVNRPQEWWFYFARSASMAGPSLLALLFWFRGGWRTAFRARGRRGRAASLALCFALVPPLLLTFSSQKGVHHLGSCSSAFALAGGLAAARLLRRRPFGRGPAVPLALAGVLGVLAGILVGVELREEEPEIPRLGRWLRAEVGERDFAIAGWGDADLGGLSFAMDRVITPLTGGVQAAEFLDRDKPAFCLLGRGTLKKFPGAVGEPGGVGVFSTAAADGRRYTLLANGPALLETPSPGTPPPPTRGGTHAGGREDR